MDTRAEKDRSSLSEQMTRLRRQQDHNEDKRQARMERRRGSDSDGEGDGGGKKRRRGVGGRETGQLNIGWGALNEGLMAPVFKWRCELCNITLGSEGLKHQHLTGAAHLKAEAKAAAKDQLRQRDRSAANAALAMAGWTASSQNDADVPVFVPQEKPRQLDHYGNEIQAKALRPHVADTGLIHKGQDYKVIQNKMTNTLLRRPPPATDAPKIQPKKKSAPIPQQPRDRGINLDGWSAPLPSSFGAAVVDDNLFGLRKSHTTSIPAPCPPIRPGAVKAFYLSKATLSIIFTH